MLSVLKRAIALGLLVAFEGALTEVAVYDRVLKAAQVAAHYNLGRPIP